MTDGKRTSRRRAFGYVWLAYLAGLIVALLTGYFCIQLGYHPLITIAAADFAGTVVVFAFSYAFDNSSFYDPYWSVIPMIIVLYLAWLGWGEGAEPVRVLAAAGLVCFWGVRLTHNWARGWKGLGHQDWRYDDLARQTGRWYWLVSFLGIHLFPTIMVYLGCLSLYPALALPGRALNVLDLLAFATTLAAIWIELSADNQLRQFVLHKKQPGDTLTTGLWKYSRHPNYFGETLFWWGLYLFALAARPDYWWTIVGPVSITFLFHFISIPMIEKRMLKRRRNYEAIQARISRWILWFPKKTRNP